MPDTILVTGGAGFIGSHTCKALARAGHRPVSFDNLSTGHADAVRFGPLVQGDVRDPNAVEAALRAHGAKAVIHFAASAYVGESMADPAKYYDNNVGGMIGLVQGCRAAGVSRIVFSSSCATYGTPDRLPIRETTPQRPINPYGRTKLIGEEILRDLGVEGMRHVALRYFNAAGATRKASSANGTIPRRTSCRSRCARPRGRAGRSRSSAPIIRRPTAPASATISMWRIWPAPMCWHSAG